MNFLSKLFRKNSNAIKSSKEFNQTDPVLDGFKITIRHIDNKISEVEKALNKTNDKLVTKDLQNQHKLLRSLKNDNQIKIFLKLVKDQEQKQLKKLEEEKAQRGENRISKFLDRDQAILQERKTQNMNFGGLTIKYTIKKDKKTGEIEIKIKEITREYAPKIPKNKSYVREHIAIGHFTKGIIDEEEKSSHTPNGTHGI